DAGQLEINGKKVIFQGTRDAEIAGVAIIHQELELVEELSVAANIFLGREPRKMFGLLDDNIAKKKSQSLLTLLEASISPEGKTGSLRVGDQQLVEIAKALSLNASIIVMDEPTSALTDLEIERLERTINTLRQQGCTILYISHKMDEVFRLADQITILRDGRLVCTVDKTRTSPSEVAGWMVGRNIEKHRFRRQKAIGKCLLEVRNLSLTSKDLSQRGRLYDVSFRVHAGEVLGIAGLMGAGRTEVLEAIFGATHGRWQGEIFLSGENVKFRHPSEACDAGLVMVPEDRKRLGVFENFNVSENISLCSLSRTIRNGFLNRQVEEDLVAEAVNQIGIKTSSQAARITQLSGGNQQKCIISRWLLTKPKVLLLDDPTRGIDVGAKADLYTLIDSLCQAGMAVVLTSSELPELLGLADRFIVMNEGRVTGEFSHDEATEQNLMAAATLG
ncbi:MAG: sugar ABC transporter ATP-binding protein, partial [Planctomycetaceae bacterium]|nr:sugar ABC transporter ATP-binding protein [Planctomycetaceae bacterium]